MLISNQKRLLKDWRFRDKYSYLVSSLDLRHSTCIHYTLAQFLKRVVYCIIFLKLSWYSGIEIQLTVLINSIFMILGGQRPMKLKAMNHIILFNDFLIL